MNENIYQYVNDFITEKQSRSDDWVQDMINEKIKENRDSKIEEILKNN